MKSPKLFERLLAYNQRQLDLLKSKNTHEGNPKIEERLRELQMEIELLKALIYKREQNAKNNSSY